MGVLGKVGQRGIALFQEQVQTVPDELSVLRLGQTLNGVRLPEKSVLVLDEQGIDVAFQTRVSSPQHDMFHECHIEPWEAVERPRGRVKVVSDRRVHFLGRNLLGRR